jgi:adenylate cyclase
MAEEQGGWRARLKRSFRQIGPARLIATFLFLLLALLAARWSWQVPLAGDAERALYDIRFAAASQRADQDSRIVLITYNDETLKALGKRSPLDRKMLSDALRALDPMGPKAIGIDILFDQAQPEDPELLATFRALRTPTFLAFASAESNDQQIEYWQEEFLRGFLREAAAGPVRPASIRLVEDDEDGVVRRWPPPAPGLPPLLPVAMSGGDRFAGYPPPKTGRSSPNSRSTSSSPRPTRFASRSRAATSSSAATSRMPTISKLR